VFPFLHGHVSIGVAPNHSHAPLLLYFLISSGLGFPFSTSSSSIPNFLVLLILSNRGGNWRAVSGLFSKKLLNSIIFTNIRRKNNFSIFFINLFYEMKRNSYDRLRKVVVSGWFVGLCGFFSVCFFFSF
jgi:hypothetical protein